MRTYSTQTDLLVNNLIEFYNKDNILNTMMDKSAIPSFIAGVHILVCLFSFMDVI